MGYQSKTWSLSDEVVAAIDKAKDERGESPNQYLKRLLKMEQTMLASGSYIADYQTEQPPARELLVELDGEGGVTLRLFMLLAYWVLELGFVTAALSTSDMQKRQTRMLFAIWFSLLGIGKILGAIAIHTGAYPLWNNK